MKPVLQVRRGRHARRIGHLDTTTLSCKISDRKLNRAARVRYRVAVAESCRRKRDSQLVFHLPIKRNVSRLLSGAGAFVMSQSAQLRGSHHCIGTGRAIADLIFKIVHDKAVANGGAISAEEILGVKAEFIVSLPSGIGFFEKVNQECMVASGSAAPDPFSRVNILSTLLSAGGNGSAAYAFRSQIQRSAARIGSTISFRDCRRWSEGTSAMNRGRI